MITVTVGFPIIFFGVKYGCEIEVYEVPKSTEQPSQHHSAPRFVNRQLPLKGRCRGDVGLV